MSDTRAGPKRRAATTPHRYLVLVFPWLTIERLRLTRPHLFAMPGEHAPIAFVETVGSTTRLAALDRAAAQAGLVPGLTLAEARGRAPDLHVFDHDPHADHRWLERLADGCRRYTPAVMVTAPDALLLDIAAGGDDGRDEPSLLADVERRLTLRGVAVRHAFGDTPAIAEALARFAGAPAPDERGALRRLPVAALGLDGEGAAALAAAGLRTVGDALGWTPTALAARFGRTVADAVRRLSRNTPPPPGRVPRAAVMCERRIAVPIVRAADMSDAVAALVGEAAAALQAAGGGGRCWQVRLFRCDGEVRTLVVETGRPTRDPATPMRMLRERLDALAEPFDPGLGFDLVRLEVPLVERLDACQLRLEGGAGTLPVVAPAAGRPRRRPSTRPPEQPELMLPTAAALSDPTVTATTGAGAAALRPIHLFDPPETIAAAAPVPADAPPRRFRWRCVLHEIARIEGPERIAGHAQGGGNVRGVTGARDYYRVEDRRGRRLWLFRPAGRGHDEAGEPCWYVHGVFA